MDKPAKKTAGREGKAVVEVTDAGLGAASGSTSTHSQRELLDQVTAALWLPQWKTQEQKLQTAKAAYESL